MLPIGRNDEIKTYLEALLKSKHFARKPKLKPLLHYVVEQTLVGKVIGEADVALDVFEKPASFDGKKDGSVRGHMLRLRAALDRHYRTEGKLDPVYIDLQPNKYNPTFEFRPNLKPRNRYTVSIIAEFENFSNFLALEPALRKASGDPTLRVIGVSVGSVLVEIECSEDGYVKLGSARVNGTLAALLGFPVEYIRRVRDTVDSGKKATMSAKEKSAAKRLEAFRLATSKAPKRIWPSPPAAKPAKRRLIESFAPKTRSAKKAKRLHDKRDIP